MSNIPAPLVSIPKEEDFDIHSLCGLQKGIQFYKNSCYVDATLMLLFYTHERMDSELKTTSPFYFHLAEIINKIRSEPFYCPDVFPTKLRECIEEHKLLGKLGIGDLMDAEEFIRKIFPHLFQRGFIFYRENFPNFVHCIFNYNTGPKKFNLLSNIFWTSMNNQGLRFTSLPNPMLIIKLPFSGGKLMGWDFIIPDPTLKVTAGENEENGQIYDLTGVMSFRSSHYVAYIRIKTCAGYKWLFSNSTGHNDISQVVSCDSLEENLQRVMLDYTEFGKTISSDLVFRDLCTTTFLAFYAPTYCDHAPKEPNSYPLPEESEPEPLTIETNDVSEEPMEQDENPVATVISPALNESKPDETTEAMSSQTISSNPPELFSAETAKFVRTEVIHLMSLVLHVFIDAPSPLNIWRQIHSCLDCHCHKKLDDACLPRIILSNFHKDLPEWKNVYQVLTSPPMILANVNENLLMDPTKVFKVILHVCKAPPFIKRESGNIYQMELPHFDDADVMTIRDKVSTLHFRANYSLILTRGRLDKSGIIPSVQMSIIDQIFNLYGVLCRNGNNFSLYILDKYRDLIRKQSWKKISCNPEPPHVAFRTIFVPTDGISAWRATYSLAECNQHDIMYNSQVWIYKAPAETAC